MARMKNWMRQYIHIISIVILSLAVFLFLYGIHVIDVTNTDWLMAGGDLSQHYLGWQFFRFAPWQFQIGMMNTIAYPYSESVIFTDSIPLFSVMFKLFRGILPKEFQFFGLWGVFCFVLQGILAMRILGNYLQRKSEICLGTVFFLLTPVFIDRMYWHSALAAHFVILFAILLFIEEENQKTPVKSAVCWSIAGVFASAIHLYFLAMCAAVLAAFVVKKCLKKEWQTAAAGTAAYFLAAAAVIWILGGFSSGMDDGAPGLGYYSFNLNGFFQPCGWSSMMPEFSYYADGQSYEGFAYLGVGIFLLVFLSFCLRRMHRIRPSKTAAAALLVSAGLLFAALSNEISLGSHLLFRFDLPWWLEKLWSPFRSSGRLIWPVVYFIMIYAVCGIKNIRKKHLRSLLLFGCLTVQLIDLGPRLLEKHNEFRVEKSYRESVDTKPLDTICRDRQINHLIFMDKDRLSQDDLYTFSDFAWKREITINDFYFARNLRNPTNEVAGDFASHPQEDCIYLFGERDRMNLVSYDLHYYRVGVYYAGVKKAVDGMQEISAEDAADFSYIFTGENVDDGWDEAGVRYLAAGGCSYGPYLQLPEGNYTVIIRGENLTESYLESYSSGGGRVHEPKNLFVEDEIVQYDLILTEDVEDYEIKITNLSQNTMKISGIDLTIMR